MTRSEASFETQAEQDIAEARVTWPHRFQRESNHWMGEREMWRLFSEVDEESRADFEHRRARAEKAYRYRVYVPPMPEPAPVTARHLNDEDIRERKRLWMLRGWPEETMHYSEGKLLTLIKWGILK